MTFVATQKLADLVVERSNHIAVRLGSRCFIVPLGRASKAVEAYAHGLDPREPLSRDVFAIHLESHCASGWDEVCLLYDDAVHLYRTVSHAQHYAG